ncbi:tRNA 5-methoxyuridine(34)/uridine 5-oxyacetic acid(34) synthase CmoB [Saccharospirillum sp. MSK14-1]|uniref:tRNA 5-methoxyuridine(34)/uridine 5-oxyacetic acid(34) synthase CmoB n=1 Tax=Saccharospirillum sp. MSK14-1 TaxID=1897632 RepID=UPI000D36F8B9|nr:tRNA 5-methoxyuridine(34)/uridine 5-oxyacetic acid(34) synthase CmoB [Saccharospirillum sp. MSK14-1]PTY37366.1 tRNA 5-methoxyuridine(34)/uridine 5-oxyacetic acid(34) synthase CmoB [Saccharospirillum sp. MSK14-1]
MIDYRPFIECLSNTSLAHWQAPLSEQMAQLFANLNDGNLPRFLQQLDKLPNIDHLKINLDRVAASTEQPLTQDQSESLNEALRGLIPWRKGPFQLFDTFIDSEWRCDLKWARVAPHLSDLKNRTVLDVGSGNGYYGWRMKAAGARLVAGIDPSWLSVVQHLAINRYFNDPSHTVLPLTLEQLTPNLEAFDTAFSMGVLYHRRSPLDHLSELRAALRPGGELLLETLVIDGGEREALVPPGRYARMNNVWFLPSPQALALWLEKVGFEDVHIVDVTHTTTEEQRNTDWKPGQSLADYLDQDDPNLTIEGLPAPLRAVLIARKPDDQQRLRRYQL